MRLSRWLMIAIALILLTACNGTATSVSGTTPTSTLPTPEVMVTSVPDSESALRLFLDSFAEEDYTAMYGLISDANRAAITVEDFAKTYLDALDNMSVQKI